MFCLQDNSTLTLFNTKTGQIEKTLTLATPAEGMMHPITYLNKLLFWSSSKMTLLNV